MWHRGSDWRPDGSRWAAAAAAAVWAGQRGAGRPGGHGLEHHGRRVLPRPEFDHQPPAEAGAECRERGWVTGTFYLFIYILFIIFYRYFCTLGIISLEKSDPENGCFVFSLKCCDVSLAVLNVLFIVLWFLLTFQFLLYLLLLISTRWIRIYFSGCAPSLRIATKQGI